MDNFLGTIDRFSRRMSGLNKLVDAVTKRIARREDAVACNDCLKYITPCIDGIKTHAYGDYYYGGGCPGYPFPPPSGNSCGGGAAQYCIPPWCYIEEAC